VDRQKLNDDQQPGKDIFRFGEYAAPNCCSDARPRSFGQLRSLAMCLQKDVFNIEAVAQHLRKLIDRLPPA
jgi:hypothetical protein